MKKQNKRSSTWWMAGQATPFTDQGLEFKDVSFQSLDGVPLQTGEHFCRDGTT